MSGLSGDEGDHLPSPQGVGACRAGRGGARGAVRELSAASGNYGGVLGGAAPPRREPGAPVAARKKAGGMRSAGCRVFNCLIVIKLSNHRTTVPSTARSTTAMPSPYFDRLVAVPRIWLRSLLLLASIAAMGGALAAWKFAEAREADAAAASQPEPVEAVSAARATEREHRRTTTSIGTVLALRSITLRNE